MPLPDDSPQLVFFVMSEKLGTRRAPPDCSDPASERCRLQLPQGPQHAWLLALCNEQGVDAVAGALWQQRDVWDRRIVGVARGRPGTVYEDDLTPWSREEQVLWSWWGHSTGCYSIHVEDF